MNIQKILAMQDSPFFTDKLNVRILPCVIFFVNGVAVERVVGFDDFGKKDDFSTAVRLPFPFAPHFANA